MPLSEFFPVYHKLTKTEQELLTRTAVKRMVPKGTLLHNGSSDCTGLFLVRSGQLRAFLTSDEGKEVTLYRLFDHDFCLFSASCMMNSIQFDITITAEKDTSIWMIPADVYKNLMETSLPIANYTSEVMATRFTDVMWLIEQIMWKSFDKRLAAFLLEEMIIENTSELRITHEKIASHLGTAREVVTRMLRYFQSEDLIKLTRGTIEILNEQELHKWT